MTTWEFAKKGNQRERNPVQDEFFNAPDTLTDVSSLVRESIQNSLDARLDESKAVKVIFTLGTMSSDSGHASYFSGLQGHLDEVFGTEKAVALSGPMNYLLVEDFNTVGLTGDSRHAEVPVDGKPSDSSYTYFVHVEGEGSKGDGKRGKWGVGKIVFPRISAAKTFFIYTVRSAVDAPDGRKTLCIGQSILKFHYFNNERVQPDGWFGVRQGEIFEPLSEHDTQEFVKFWDLARSEEPGLSVVVPYIEESVTLKEIRDAIIRQYFVAILEGTLVCEIRTNEGFLVLDEKSLVFEAPKIEMTKAASLDRTAEEMQAAIELVSSSSGLDILDFKVEITDSMKSASEFYLSKEELTELSDKLKSGSPLRISVAVNAPDTTSVKSPLLKDNFVILFQENEQLRCAPIYSRQGIIVPGTNNTKISGYISVVLVGPGPIANVLGLSEGPAHEKWSDQTKKFRETFGNSTKAKRLIPIVRNLPHRLVSLAVSQSGTFDNSALNKWMSVLKTIESGKANRVPSIGSEPAPSPINNPDAFSIHSIKGGFVISPGDASLPIGALVEVKVAYSRAKGDPFKNWKKEDFLLESNFELEGHNAIDLSGYGNSIKFRISDKLWEVRCTGFSPILDLEVAPDWHLPDSSQSISPSEVSA
jgi:hypothetical protein